MDNSLENCLKSDIENICRIYLSSEEEQKEDIRNIVDKVYLLIAGKGNLKRLYSTLQKEFCRHLREKGKRAAELLDVDPELIGAKSHALDAYDQRLLCELDALAEKLEKQAKPNPAAVALLGALNPALKAVAPAISEAGTKDHALILRVRARLAELLKEGESDGV